MTAALVALTMVVMAMTPLINETENLDKIGTVGYDHGTPVQNGTATLGGILTWQDDAWDASWTCNGGLALVTADDWSDFIASGDNDPHNYTSWGLELTGAGSYWTDEAPEGEWVVTAGLGCVDDAGEPRAAGGQFGDVHESPPTVSLTNNTTVGDVSFTLIENTDGPGGWDYEDGYAGMDISLNPGSPYDASWECDNGGVALLNQSGMDAWEDGDGGNEEHIQWATEVNVAGTPFNVDNAPEGGWFVVAGLECREFSTDDWTFFGGEYREADGTPILIMLINNETYADLVYIDLMAGDDDDGPPSAEELMFMWDADGDDNLSLVELIDGINDMNSNAGEPPLSDEEEAMFSHLFNESDSNGDGLLDYDELVYFLEDLEDDGPTFVCGNGDVIPFYLVNDGNEDCDDGSDEPQDFDGDGVTDNWFDCHDGSNVSMDLVNDGTEDCPDGEDEGHDGWDDTHWESYYGGHCEWEGNEDDHDTVWWCKYSADDEDWDTWWYYCENHDSDWHCTDEFGQSDDYEYSADGTQWSDDDDGPPSPEELLLMFDADGDGNLSLEEIIDGVNSHNSDEGYPPLSDEEEGHIGNAFNMSDADGNGLLDIDELEDFIDIMEEGGDPDWTYGEATLDATTYVMSPDYDTTMMCQGGVGLVTAADFAEWTVLQDDPFDYLTWGTEHHTSGSVVDDTAPEGEYIVFAGIECMDSSGIHWMFAGYDMSADGTPTMHTFTNGATTTVEINLFNMDDGGGDGEDYFDCEGDDSLSIFFEEVASDLDGVTDGTITFTSVCTLSASDSDHVRLMIDEDGDGNVSATELSAFMATMLDSEADDCYDEDGTAIPCGEDDGVFEFDGVEFEAMNDVSPETISGVIEGGVITMTSTEVINVGNIDPTVDSHTMTYQSTDADGGDEECSGSLSIDSASPWTTATVSFNPTDDWLVEHLADGTWLVSNVDSDGDGECNSEPTDAEIVWTRPASEPVIDTTPVCDIYYHVGGAVLTAGSTWSVQLQGAVSFEVPSDGEFTLALPVGEYSVVLACNDAESDSIDVMVTHGTETREGTAQDGVIYVEALFNITEDNVSNSVDITLVWESTDFGGTFNIHFTAVESIADAIEDSDTGGLPGFTSVITITAMLGAAMILARRKD